MFSTIKSTSVNGTQKTETRFGINKEENKKVLDIHTFFNKKIIIRKLSRKTSFKRKFFNYFKNEKYSKIEMQSM